MSQWHPIGEPPECKEGERVRIIIEDNLGKTYEGLYVAPRWVETSTDLSSKVEKCPGVYKVRCEQWYSLDMRAVRWHPWPQTSEGGMKWIA